MLIALALMVSSAIVMAVEAAHLVTPVRSIEAVSRVENCDLFGYDNASDTTSRYCE